MMSGDDVLTEPVARRIEVFTGAGRRRKWSAKGKARIVAESYGSSVGAVADRYGLAKNQLFAWRREARGKAPAAEALRGKVAAAAQWRRNEATRGRGGATTREAVVTAVAATAVATTAEAAATTEMATVTAAPPSVSVC